MKQNRLWLWMFWSLAALLLFNSCLHYRLRSKLEKADYQKARPLLYKSLHKNPQDPENLHFAARFFGDSASPFRQPDSLYYYALRGQNQWQQTSQKRRQKLKEKGISADTFAAWQYLAQQRAFRQARDTLSEAAMRHYLKRFPGSPFEQAATRLRDSIAFAKAAEANTYQSYRRFLKKYPEAPQVPRAQALYEKLVYRDATRAGTVAAYQRFTENYPDNRWVPQAQQRMFRRYCGDNRPGTYRRFAQDYPHHPYADTAFWFAYYRLTQGLGLPQPADLRAWPERQALDLLARDTAWWFPFREQGQWRFMDEQGHVHFPNFGPQPTAKVRCKAQGQQLIPSVNAQGQKGIWLKARGLLRQPQYRRVRDLGFGMIQVSTDSGAGLLHKSGMAVLPARYQAVKVLDTHFVAGKTDSGWGLYSWHGRQLSPHSYQQIRSEGGWLLFLQANSFGASAPQDFIGKRSLNPHQPALPFDEIATSHPGYLEVRIGQNWGVINRRGEFIISTQYRQLNRIPGGWLLEKPKGQSLYFIDKGEQLAGPYQRVSHNKRYLALKKGQKWGLLARDGQQLQPFRFDSIAFMGNQVVQYFQGGNRFVSFRGGALRDFSGFQKLSLQTNLGWRDEGEAAVFLLEATDETGKAGLYNRLGEKVLPHEYSRITLIDQNVLVAKKAGKSYLVDTLGRRHLSEAFSGAGKFGEYISLLKGHQFGLFSEHPPLRIPARFSAGLEPYRPHASLFIAQKAGKKGLVNAAGKPVLPLNFQEVVPWTADSFLVRKGGLFRLVGQDTAAGSLRPRDSIVALPGPTYQTPKGPLVKAKSKAGQHGLFSAQGWVWRPQYRSIENIGTRGRPLFVGIAKKDEDHYAVTYLNNRLEVIYQTEGNRKALSQWLCPN